MIKTGTIQRKSSRQIPLDLRVRISFFISHPVPDDGGNMKREVDYEAATEYDWTLFTEEDRKQYKTILLSMPYDPDFAGFFHGQKRLETRENNLRRRYISEKATAAFNCGKLEIPYDNMEEEEFMKEQIAILRREIEQLDSIPQRRVKAYFFEDRTYKTIASAEHVSAAAVCECVQLAMEKIKAGFSGKANADEKKKTDA